MSDEKEETKKPKAKKAKVKEEKPLPEWKGTQYEFAMSVRSALMYHQESLRKINRRYEMVANNIHDEIIELVGMLSSVEAARESGECNIIYTVGENCFGYKLTPRKCGFRIDNPEGIEKVVKNPK